MEVLVQHDGLYERVNEHEHRQRVTLVLRLLLPPRERDQRSANLYAQWASEKANQEEAKSLGTPWYTLALHIRTNIFNITIWHF